MVDDLLVVAVHPGGIGCLRVAQVFAGFAVVHAPIGGAHGLVVAGVGVFQRVCADKREGHEAEGCEYCFPRCGAGVGLSVFHGVFPHGSQYP